jgi:hypothetical protein
MPGAPITNNDLSVFLKPLDFKIWGFSRFSAERISQQNPWVVLLFFFAET